MSKSEDFIRTPNMGDVVELKIEELNINGEGIVVEDGKKFCVGKVLPGERVLASIKKIKKNYVGCGLEKIVQSHSQRVVPPCMH